MEIVEQGGIAPSAPFDNLFGHGREGTAARELVTVDGCLEACPASGLNEFRGHGNTFGASEKEYIQLVH